MELAMSSIAWHNLVFPAVMLAALIFILAWAALRAMRPYVIELWRLFPQRWRLIAQETLRRLWGGFVGATLGTWIAFVVGIVSHWLGWSELLLVLLPACMIPGFILGLMFGNVGSDDRRTGAYAPTQPGTTLLPWAEAAFYSSFFALLILPAPLPLALGIIAIWDIVLDPKKHGLGRALFAVVISAPITLLLADAVFEICAGGA